MGMRRDVQGRGIDALLYDAITKSCLKLGIRKAELSWVLESNAAMNNTLRRAGCRISRTYRVYEGPV
jgi:hypothetical protein